MKNKLIASFLVCAIAASLFGCQTQTPDVGVQLNDKPVDKVTLSFFSPVETSWENGSSFRDSTLLYSQAHSDVQIAFEGVSTADGYDQFLLERLDTGSAVDIFIVNAESVKSIAQKGQFYDLSGLESFDLLTRSAQEQATVNGIAYTIPLEMAVYVMNVNVSLLERNGLEVPQNYADFMACCRTLKAQGVTPIALNRWWAMAVPVMARGLAPLYQAENRAQLIDELNRGEAKIGDYMLEGFAMFEQFLNEGCYGEELTAEQVDAIKANTQDAEDFESGRVAFRFVPISNLEPTTLENGDKCVFAGIPMLAQGVITLPSIATRLCINANSPNLETTVSFADFLVTQRIDAISRQTATHLSPFHASTEVKADCPWARSVLGLLEADGQIPLEDMNLHFSYWDNTRALCLAMVDGMSAQEAAQEFNRIQQEELQAYGKK